MNRYALVLSFTFALGVNAAPVPRHREPVPISRDDLVGNWRWSMGASVYVVALCRDGYYCSRCIGDVGARWVGRWELVGGELVILETPIDYPEATPVQYRFRVTRSKGKICITGDRGQLSRTP